jgi:aryl-alcohol dehydrogenase-like predicted oxidoreductase
MPRRVLGRTGWEVSVVPFSGFALTRDEQDVCTAAVRHALDRGVNYFDVAPAYGNGVCETRLGAALQGVERSSYYLACKTNVRDRDGARAELERSLQRLGTDHFDLYQLHHLSRMDDVERAFGPGGAMETLVAAREEGKIRAVGFSAHTTPAALEAMRSHRFDTVMFPINYVEYFTLGFGKEILELAAEQGAAVLSIKTINAGAWPEGAERTRPWWYRPLEEQEQINLAYRWTLSLPGVVMGFSPAWLDLQAKAIEAGHALRPAAPEDGERLRAMAAGCGSLFDRERARVAQGDAPHLPYPYHPDQPGTALA